MATIFIRTLFIYVFLLITMRFMGKRQLGELEISELVTTLLLSEIASLPITNNEISLLHAVIPIVTLMSLEVLLSAWLLKSAKLKSLLSIRPTFLICKGKLRENAMRSVRISYEELLSQLRQKDILDIADVYYAILEPNGTISVIPRSSAQNPTVSELGLYVHERGMMHTLISEGKINTANLSLINKDVSWIESILRSRDIDLSEVSLMTADDAGNLRLVISGGDGSVTEIEQS